MKASKVAQMIKLFNDGVPILTVLEIMITLEPNKQRLAIALVKFFRAWYGMADKEEPNAKERS